MPNLIERLDALSEALDKATPGEWEWDSGAVPPDGPGRYSDIYVDGGNLLIASFNDCINEGKSNADAITLSVNFLREHIGTLREALRDAGRWRMWIAMAEQYRAGGGPLVDQFKADPQPETSLEAIARIDAAIDQERGDRLGRDGGDRG